MANTISICHYELSRYHAGQIVTPSAKIWCDGNEWHSLVSWYDASDQTTSHHHATHATKVDAEKAVSAEVIVMSERWLLVDAKSLASLKKIGNKYELGFRLEMTGDGECRLDGAATDPREVCGKIAEKFRRTKLEKWNKKTEQWEFDFSSTAAMQEAVSKAMK